MDLIPSIPNELARECLIRVTYKQFATVQSVCRDWKREIESPEFRRQRKDTGRCQNVFVFAQAQVDPNRKSGVLKSIASPVYKLTLLDPGTGKWSDLPPVPGFSGGLPMFSQLVAVGSELVLLGGFDPVSLKVSNSVYVFSFLSASWRRGADMPGVRRWFFGCASDYNRRVYVAGGHDGDKTALKSVMAYDVAEDKWIELPDMVRERDECKGIYHRGKFHVIGGYCTQRQGRFERSAEAFDVATWKWDQVQEDFLEGNTCPRTCTFGDDVECYMCCDGSVIALRGSRWSTVSKLPAEVANAAYVTTWQDNLFVIGCSSYGEPHLTYTLDLKRFMWTKLDTPLQHSGHVQAGCYIEL